jgi:hypothetical protein
MISSQTSSVLELESGLTFALVQDVRDESDVKRSLIKKITNWKLKTIVLA